MQVPFIDLAQDHSQFSEELVRAFCRVLGSGRFVTGSELSELENALAQRIGTRFAVGVSSGTDALLCALLALGVQAGDQVITTPFTFVATAEAIARRGAIPRFVDVNPDSLTLDPAAVARALSAQTRAIIAVHLFGHAADLVALGELAAKNDVPLVEDVAQAFGATLDGRTLGAWGDVACFSFFPTKVLGALGDAGAIATSSARLAERCRRLRQHGLAGPEQFSELGGNFRMDELQAAFLRVKLSRLETSLAARRARAARYAVGLQTVDGVVLPRVAAAVAPVWSVYTLRVVGDRRAALQAHLTERGIQTRVYYARPLHLQPVFAHLGYKEGDFPNAERASREVLSLPIYPSLTEAQQDHVIDSIHAFFRS